MVVVISTSMFAVINSLLVLIMGKPFIVFSNAFITDKITEYRLYDYARGRIYMLSYIDLIVPFVTFVFFLKPQTIFKKLWIPFILMLEMLTIFLSNYRGITLAGVMGMALILIFKKAPNRLFLALILISLLISLFFQAKTGNVIDRLLLKSQEDTTSITSRIVASGRALHIGASNPLFGIGLGNFINYAEWVWLSSDRRNIIVYQNPHNAYLMLFALFIIWFVNMVKNDFNFLVKQGSDSNNIILPFIVSSWIYIAVNLVNWYSANYIVYFFLLRGLFHGWYQLCLRPKELKI
jgi:O-antigen ligase